VDEALNVAHQYKFCFSMWHKNRYLAELVSPTVIPVHRAANCEGPAGKRVPERLQT
jgi:hypothetical protein